MNRGFRRLTFSLCAVGAVLWVAPLHAQATGTITGRVTDVRNGAPIEGAEVVIDAHTGATTDGDGRFRLPDVPVGNKNVNVHMIGYAARDTAVLLAVGQTATLELALTAVAVNMDAIVTTGQGGDISKRRIATTVDVISNEAIEKSSSTRIDDLLQSNLPAAEIKMTSGDPGTTSIIRTRGINSVASNTTPVIYVDGVRVDNLNTAATLAMNLSGSKSTGTATSALCGHTCSRISDHIEFIPGGAATTLYGSDAANGVIQIFMKHGSAGVTTGFFQDVSGFDTPDGQFHHFKATDKILYRNGATQEYSGGMEGGVGAMTYSLSANARASQTDRIDGDNSASGFNSALGAAVGSEGHYQGSFSYNESTSPRFRNGNSGGFQSLWLLEGGRSSAFGFDNNLDSPRLARPSTKLKSFVQTAEALENNSVFVAIRN